MSLFSLRTLILILAMGFACAHTQAPLFYSNQNQYLLHGLAHGGQGKLHHDWLAKTHDPTPVFSFALEMAFRLAGLWSIHAAYFALLAAYFVSMWLVVVRLPGVQPTRQTALVFAALFTSAHAAIFRWLSVQLVGVDYPWYLQSGLAGQYLLGPGIQPSSFGVLQVASLAAFLHSRYRLAAILVAAAAVMHPTYLLTAAVLTLGYITTLARDGRYRLAVQVGGLSFAVVLPMLAYILATFPPTTAETFHESQRILAIVRIPHHTVAARWFDGVAALQLAWIALGLGLLRKTVLFPTLFVPVVLALVLTLIQIANQDHTLALLFPWRVSVVLVPLATAVIAVGVTSLLPARPVFEALFACVFILEAVCGVVLMVKGVGYAMNEAERPTLAYVRGQTESSTGTDVYLIPTRIPAVGTGRGSISTSFTTPPRPRPGSNLIPVDLQRFRLATGAPIFVDFKSVPYADVEVLEWYRRIQLVECWYKELDWDRAGLADVLAKEGITHVVIPRDLPIRASFMEVTYADDAYGVYRIKR